MRKLVCVVAAMLALTLVMQFAMARDTRKTKADQTVTGILIDQACGTKMMEKPDPSAAAAKHTKSCATKESCEKSGYAVITDHKMLKFDEKGDKLAKEFLAKTDKESDLRVTVEGTEADGKIAVTSLKAAE